MNANSSSYHLKKLFLYFFSIHSKMCIGKMYFRLFDPEKEQLVCRYCEEDWNNIFPDTKEDDMIELSSCSNVIILVWCEIETDYPHGMIYLEENRLIHRQISFHGGTWEHNPQFYVEIFRSLTNLFDALLKKDFEITTTCSLLNQKADRFQNSFGFVEERRTELLIYKILDNQKYEESIIVKKMRIPHFNLLS